MSFANYLRSCIFEFLLMCVLAISASGLVASGFVSGDAFIDAVVPLVATCVVSVALLYCFAYSKRTAMVGVGAVVVLTIAAVFVASRFWNGSSIFADEPGNPCPPLLACIVTTVAVFLLSRRRAGQVALVICAVIVIGYLQFVFAEFRVAFVVALVFSLVCTLMYRYFLQSRPVSKRGLKSLAIAFGSCCMACVLLVGLSAGVYAAVIAPMNPPTMEIKLIKEYLALPQLDMRGIANRTPLEDERNQTNQQDQDENLSSGEGSQNEDQDTQGSGEQADQGSSQEVYNQSATDSAYAPTWFEIVLGSIPVALLLVLLVAAVIGLKLWLRKRRKERLLKLPRDQQIAEVYGFCLKKFEQLKLGKKPEMTPYEFAQSSKPFLQAFVDSDGTDFSYITDMFVQSAYGKAQLTDEQHQKVLHFYDEFLKCCKNHLGVVGYALRFFFL